MITNQTGQQDRSSTRRLGRGLGSLLSSVVSIDIPKTTSGAEPSSINSNESVDPQTTAQPVEGISMLPLDLIQANPRQPRSTFDEQSLASLAASIRSAGVMQPVLVRLNTDDPASGGLAAPSYQLIAGERRWRAARIAGLAAIPAIVRQVDDRTAAELALVENIQREDLNPIERAEAFRVLIDDFNLSQQELADRVGLDRSTIANFIRLNELDDSLKLAVGAGRLTFGHARALLSINDITLRRTIGQDAARLAWSVRELERHIRQALAASAEGPRPPGTKNFLRPSAQMQSVCRQLSAQLGTRLLIQSGRKKGTGRIVIDFYSIEQFQSVMLRMNLKIE